MGAANFYTKSGGIFEYTKTKYINHDLERICNTISLPLENIPGWNLIYNQQNSNLKLFLYQNNNNYLLIPNNLQELTIDHIRINGKYFDSFDKLLQHLYWSIRHSKYYKDEYNRLLNFCKI